MFPLLRSFLPRIGSVDLALLNDAKGEGPLFDAIVPDYAETEVTIISILKHVATSLTDRQIKTILEGPGAVSVALDFFSRPSQDLCQAVTSVLSRGFSPNTNTILEVSAVTELVILSQEQALDIFRHGLHEFIRDTKKLVIQPPQTELGYSLLADFVPLLRQLGTALKIFEVPSHAKLFELEHNRSLNLPPPQPENKSEQHLSRLWATAWEAIVCGFAVATLSPSPEEHSMIEFLVALEKMLADNFLSTDLKKCYQSARKASPSDVINKSVHPLLKEDDSDDRRLFCHQFERWIFYLFPWLACDVSEISERTMRIVEVAAGAVLEGTGLKRPVVSILKQYSQSLPEAIASRLGDLVQHWEDAPRVLPLPSAAPPRPSADITHFFKKTPANSHPSEEPQWLSKSHHADLAISAVPMSRHTHHEREPPTRTLPTSFIAVSPHPVKKHHPTGSSHSTFQSKELRELAKTVSSKSAEPPKIKHPVSKSSDIRPFSDIGELSADQTRVREQLQGSYS